MVFDLHAILDKARHDEAYRTFRPANTPTLTHYVRGDPLPNIEVWAVATPYTFAIPRKEQHSIIQSEDVLEGHLLIGERLEPRSIVIYGHTKPQPSHQPEYLPFSYLFSKIDALQETMSLEYEHGPRTLSLADFLLGNHPGLSKLVASQEQHELEQADFREQLLGQGYRKMIRGARIL